MILIPMQDWWCEECKKLFIAEKTKKIICNVCEANHTFQSMMTNAPFEATKSRKYSEIPKEGKSSFSLHNAHITIEQDKLNE